MNIFFDTSALVKYFQVENGTAQVTELINDDQNNIIISELAKLEFYSALHRRFRNRELDEKSLSEVFKYFDLQLTAFSIEPLSNLIVKEGENILKAYGARFGLRTLDALQLSSFKLIAEKGWFFASCDTILCDVVQLMNYDVINPLNDSSL